MTSPRTISPDDPLPLTWNEAYMLLSAQIDSARGEPMIVNLNNRAAMNVAFSLCNRRLIKRIGTGAPYALYDVTAAGETIPRQVLRKIAGCINSDDPLPLSEAGR